MKSLDHSFLAVVIAVFGLLFTLSCERSNESDNGLNPTQQFLPVGGINVDIPFEPIRLARATTDRNRDGKNCGCNECFGLCNRPITSVYGGESSYIGLTQISETSVGIYFLYSLPNNFETEFGIDETIILECENHTYSLKIGEYSAFEESGLVYCERFDENIEYFAFVEVDINE
jgi:hypothetical protein